VSGVTVGGHAAPPWEVGLTFGVVGDIHIRVCMSNSLGLRDVASSPHGSLSLEQVAVAKFLLADTL
jgi:hypothetical protein